MKTATSQIPPKPRPSHVDNGPVVVSEKFFRSSGTGVDKTDNMVRVTIDMTRNKWYELKKILKK